MPMMRRNGKLTAFILATVCVAGCANSKEGLSKKASFQARRSEPRIDPRRVKDVKTPKIRPETHLAAGRLFERVGQWTKALGQYRKAVAVNGRNVTAYHRLGLLASRAGNHDEAIKAFRRAVALGPNDAILRNNLGFELLSVNRFDEAEGELTRAVKLDPTFARAQVNLGILQCKLGRFDDGLASFLTVLPEADAFYNLGLMYRGQRRYLEASRAFRQVLVMEPGFTAAVTQIEKMMEHMSPASSPRPAPKFAAGVIPKPPRTIATAPRSAQPDVRKRDVNPAIPVSPTVHGGDDSKPWASTFALLDKVLGSNETVDAFPTTDVPPARLEGYPLEDRTALEEIADNERDCLQEEADLRAEMNENELDATAAMAWADDAEAVACEAIEACEADDLLLVSMNTDDFAIPASFVDDTPVSWLSDAHDQPRQVSRDDELRRLLPDDAPGAVGRVSPETNVSFADSVWDDDARVGPQTSPATYAVPAEASLIAEDRTEWDIVPVRVAEEKVSSVDSLALLRTLAEELAIVRNDIECVDQNAQLASAIARQSMMPAADRYPGPQAGVPVPANSLVGPPAALAIPASYRPASSPAALLASQPRKTGSPRDKARTGAKQRGRKVNKKRNPRTKTSQATPTGDESRPADLRGFFGHEPNPPPN